MYSHSLYSTLYIIAVYCIHYYVHYSFFVINSCFKIKSGTTFGRKSGRATGNENMAERQCKSVTLQEKIKVIRRTEGG
jgi:hypothetical protein